LLTFFICYKRNQFFPPFWRGILLKIVLFLVSCALTTMDSDVCPPSPCTVNLAPAQSHIWHMLCNMLHNYPLLASLQAYLAHHVSKKWWGIFDTCKAKYPSHLTYCPSFEATCHIVWHIWLCAGTDLQCGLSNCCFSPRLWGLMDTCVSWSQSLLSSILLLNVTNKCGFYLSSARWLAYSLLYP
jgi:hypothetical protein